MKLLAKKKQKLFENLQIKTEPISFSIFIREEDIKPKKKV